MVQVHFYSHHNIRDHPQTQSYLNYRSTPQPITSPNPNYQSNKSGTKRHINRYVNPGRPQEVQTVRAPNPSYPRNVNRYYGNEQSELSYNNQV
jgi:hypothetical protein